jgi:hypothetical protein
VRPIRYLFDENVDPALRQALQRRWPELEVWKVGDPAAPGRGTLDPDILLRCEANEFILVTNNRASMPVHLRDHLAEGRHVRGIFVLRPSHSIGVVADDLGLIWAGSEPSEYTDQLRHIPLG